MLKIKESYGIKNIKTNEILVEYRTYQGNSKKSIFSMKRNAQRVIDNYLDSKQDYRVCLIKADLVEEVD